MLSVLLTLSFGGCVICTFDLVLVDVLSMLLTLSFGGCFVCAFDPVFW
jgi:hypothetical protein